jgi:hypothetical protein
MKKLNYVFITVFSICLLAACDVTDNSNEFLEESLLTKIEQGENANNRFHNSRKSVPFKATFSTIRNLDESPSDPELCGSNPAFFKNVQEGTGTATHLGRFTTKIIFCMDASDLLPTDDTPGELTEGESIPYFNGTGTFTAANGDQLYFTISGAVLPSNHPDYDFEFQDPFTFTGGTGRFSGAEGSGMTNSFVDFAADRTDHEWTGMIRFDRLN